MSIDAYCSSIKQICDEVSILPLVIVCEITFDKRPPDQAYIVGRIEWMNGFELHWKEFVNATPILTKLRYSYHFQNSDKLLIFRYDNALHKPHLPYREHLHTDRETIIEAASPTLEQVIEKCLTILDH